jgi:ceramide glucosyltransferase
LKLRIDLAYGAKSGPIWLLPVRDVISFGIFLASFLGKSVDWRGTGFDVASDGVLSEHKGE